MPTVPRILEGHFDFLNIMQNLNNLPEYCTLVLFDVVGFYPHMLHEEGMSTLTLKKGKRQQ